MKALAKFAQTVHSSNAKNHLLRRVGIFKLSYPIHMVSLYHRGDTATSSGASRRGRLVLDFSIEEGSGVQVGGERVDFCASAVGGEEGACPIDQDVTLFIMRGKK